MTQAVGNSTYSTIASAQLLGLGDARICIAILDGMVDTSHPCFFGANISIINSLGLPTEPPSIHGTKVASIIFGQPGSQVSGLAPHCRGLVIPIFSPDSSSDSNQSCSQLDLARAIVAAIEGGANIINISGGQLSPSGEPDQLLAYAIESCVTHNVLIVAAAGNDGCDCLHVPAASDAVLAVGAMDSTGSPLSLSNWGSKYRNHGVIAPGADVLGATPGGGTARSSGTSFATPYVSGLAGLLASQRITSGELFDAQVIRNSLLERAIPCTAESSDDCQRWLYGRLSINEFLTRNEKGNTHMTNLTTIKPSAAPDSAVNTTDSIEERVGITTSSAGTNNAKTANCVDMSSPVKLPAASVSTGAVSPTGCGCGGGESCTCNQGGPKKSGLVYALGLVDYDLGSEAHRDSLVQSMPAAANNPMLKDQLLAFLESEPYEAASIIWTLNLDATPIYAIQPAGAFASNVYGRLREFLRGQLTEGVELVSIPGVIAGSVRLQSGQVVPSIVPVMRGMYSWTTSALVKSVMGVRPEGGAEQVTFDRRSSGLADFLNRVYYDLRNLGVLPQERALNYAATNAFQISEVIRSTTEEELDLDTIAVKKSPICRPDSDCYDVELAFYNPNNENVANRIYRLTVDVSDVVPVTVGAVRSWTRRA